MPANLFTSNSKRIYLAVLFVTMMLVFNYVIGRIYESSASKNKINTWNKQRFTDFYALPQNSLDMVFVGSSHSYCSFDPEEIDKLLEVNSFQFGMPAQNPDSTYYTLLEIYRYQSPKTVVFELYWDMLDKDFEPQQIESLFQVLNNEELKKDYISAVFPLSAKIMHYTKPIRFQTDYLAYINSELLKSMKNRYDLEQKEQIYDGQEYYKTKGFIFCDYVMSAKEFNDTLHGEDFDGKKYSISKKQMYYINKIIELCKQQNSKLIFVTAPVASVTLGKIKSYSAIHNAVASIASKNDIRYLDLNLVNMNTSLFADSDFRDKNHLNYIGSKKAGLYFSDWLKRQNIL